MTQEISSDDYDIPPIAPAFAPMAPVPLPEGIDLDQNLAYTQARRLQLAEALAPKIAQEDPKVINAYLKTLDGMDKASISKRRLGVEEAAQATSEEEAKNGAEVLKMIERTMFQAAAGVPVQRTIPTLDGSVPRPTLVPGETDVGVANITYESFTKGIPAEDS